eukprot:PhF_6_TR28107/c0_g1_i1/m.41554/K15356/VRG4, GONST1; GDP-mannose transporter
MPPPEATPLLPPSLAQHGAFLVALLQFTVSSVGMMLGNKVALDPEYGGLPLACTLVLIQVVSTLVLLAVFCRSYVWHITISNAIAWFPISLLFALMLYTSLRSLLYATVSTVLILRNIGAILTTIVEYYVRGVTVTKNILASEILIVIGAVMYGWNTSNFTPVGFFWVLFNVGAQVCYGVLLKHRMETHPSIKEMNKYTMSLYNNALGFPMFLVVWTLQGEHNLLPQHLEKVTFLGTCIIASTCLIGFMISVSGFALQKLVSATSFLVINNLTKFLNILLGMILLRDRLIGILDTSGCILALGAGAWYSFEQSRGTARPAH